LAFDDCDGLTSVTFESDKIQLDVGGYMIGSKSFPGDLGYKYLAGGAGTYTSQEVVRRSSVWGRGDYIDWVWTKQ
jgi:hypothetical protein